MHLVSRTAANRPTDRLTGFGFGAGADALRRIVNDVTLHFDVLQSTVVRLYGVQQELAQRRSTGKNRDNVRAAHETQIGKGREKGD